jgi:rhamnosyltransferase
VVATYNPDLQRLARVMDAVAPQVAQAFVVDDASPQGTPKGVAGRATLIELPENAGLAAALNRGAKLALEQRATHLLFLDQDSVAPSNLVARLLGALDGQRSVAAIGPAWRDVRSGRRSARPGRTSFLIMSGMLVPAAAFEKVGGFDEALGVDSVDREWCFRALAAGYQLLQVADITLDHRIGDAPLRGGWTRHRPERLYTMMRNRVLLYRRAYVPWQWKVVDLLRAAGKLVVFSVFFPPRCENLRQMLRGLRDGAQMRRR